MLPFPGRPDGDPRPLRLILDGGDGSAYDFGRPGRGQGLDLLGREVPVAPLGTFSYNGLYRYPAETRQSVEIADGGDAYFRDVSVRFETTIEADADGETWRVDVVHSDGFVEQGSTITFRENWNGQKNCFVVGSSSLCAGTWVWFTVTLTTQCAKAGVYQIKMYQNGAEVRTASFRVVPTIPPDAISRIWNQGAYPTQHYDNACQGTKKSVACRGTEGEVKKTIKQKGCALVSGVMLLDYHGVETDPLTLNSWMNSNGYFQPGGNVDWRGFARYAKTTVDSVVAYKQWGPNTLSELRNRICRFGPQIIHVKNGTHFVLATGMDQAETTVAIYDPAGGQQTTLFDRYRTNTFQSMRMFQGQQRTDTIGHDLVVTFHSPGEVWLTDPFGRRTGIEPGRGAFNEIPNSSYGAVAMADVREDEVVSEEPEEPVRELNVGDAAPGDYIVDVTGTGAGTYILTIKGYGSGWRSSTAEYWDVPIGPGEVHSYRFRYDPATAGTGVPLGMSGAFSGGGQRAAVDELLSYGRPGQRQTELPAGTAAYSLMISYGPGLDPASFSAELNGAVVTSMFQPAPGGSNVVSIPLQRGRNVLVLGASGVVGGRTTVDRDRLTFRVP